MKNHKDKNFEKMIYMVKVGLISPRSLLGTVKSMIDDDLYFNRLGPILKSKKIINSALPNPFPKKINQILNDLYLAPSHNFISEIIVAIHICIEFSKELYKFEKIREEFERNFLLDNHDNCKKLLDKIKNDFGYSIWFISASYIMENKFKVELDSQIIDLESNPDGFGSTLVGYLASYLGVRSEGVAIRGSIKKKIDGELESYSGSLLKKYIDAKITANCIRNEDECMALLRLDSRASLIDLYDSLRISLQSLTIKCIDDDKFNLKLISSVKKLVHYIDSPSNRCIARIFNIPVELPCGDHYLNSSRIIDQYTLGNYKACILEMTEYIRSYSSDIFMIELLSKCIAKSDIKEIDIKDGLLKNIILYLENIYLKRDSTFKDANSLLNISYQYDSLTWASALNILVCRLLSPPQKKYPGVWDKAYFILSPNETPMSLFLMGNDSKKNFLQDLVSGGFYKNTIQLIELLISGSSDIEGHVEKSRSNFYLSFFYIGKDRWEDAIAQLEKVTNEGKVIDNLHACCYLSFCYLMKKNIIKAVEIAVNAYLDNKFIVRNLPIDAIFDYLNDGSHEWPNLIEICIFFDMYCANVSEKSRAHLRVSFEKFQNFNKMKSPLDVLDLDISTRLKVAYLKNVCTPKTMQQTMLYEGTREIEEERVRICQKLLELDPDNENEYMEEIRDRVKNLEINKALQLIGKSKVYVDIETISKILRSKLTDSYDKFKRFAETNTYREMADLKNRIYQIVEEISRLDDNVNNDFAVKIINSDANKTSDVINNEIINEFLLGEHGLNSYLSTQIRHGTINNTLRKPVEDENLIFNKENNEYKENYFWSEKEEQISESQYSELLGCLSRFSKEYDELIQYITKNLLQIKIFLPHEKESSSEALFVYKFTSRDFHDLEQKLNSSESIDSLIDQLMDWLWSRTDKNLAIVKEILRSDISIKFNSIFDRLTNEISEMDGEIIHELNNSIARARSSFQVRLDEVISWFDRNEVYERQDYDVEFPAQIAQKMIQNTRSKISEDFKINFFREKDFNVTMPGRTLDGFVYIFYELFQNALSRSRLLPSQINLKVDLSMVNDMISIVVTNCVNKDSITDADLAQVNLSRSQLGKEIQRKKIQEEGGTGLLKIYKTLSSPIYVNSEFKFGFNEDNSLFNVIIKFKVG